ncbi:MAG TPA: ferritin, partial [Actinobacteria bacterium]|nr:ferritin [Actinomycetota bacterium]
MRLSDTMIKAFNEQLTREFQASYLYTQMAAWLYAAG